MKGKRMNKLSIAIFLVFVAVFVSCNTSKKATNEPQIQANEKSNLSEEKKIEFEYLYIEGLKQKMLGNAEMAIQYFNNCVEINPQSAASLYELANIYASKGELVTAKLLLQKATQINPNNRWYKILLAQIYQNSNQYTEASEIYTELIKQEPDNIDFLYMNAILLSTSGDTDKAIKAYNDLEKNMGYNEQIALSRQNIYRQAGKNKEAYAEIEKLIEFAPEVPEYYGILADMYKEDGNLKKALEYYNKVIEIDPTNGFVNFSLATLYIQNNDIEKGYDYARKGFSNKNVELETKIQLYLMLSTAPAELKISDEQLENLIKIVLEIHPDDARSYGIMADYLMQRERTSEARDYMQQAIETDTNSYMLWEQLLITENQLSDFESMAKNSQKAIQLFPTQPMLYLLNAVSNIQLKNYQQALTSLDNGQIYVVDNKQLNAQFDLYRAETFYNLDKSDKAFIAFEEVIKNDPENFMALNNYAYYLSVRGEQLEKAELMSSKVIQANPDNPTYLDTHAWVLFMKGEYRLAKFYIENAIKNGGESSEVVVEHYGDILFKLNDIDKAMEQWQKSLEMGNTSETLKKKIAEKKYIAEVE